MRLCSALAAARQLPSATFLMRTGPVQTVYRSVPAHKLQECDNGQFRRVCSPCSRERQLSCLEGRNCTFTSHDRIRLLLRLLLLQPLSGPEQLASRKGPSPTPAPVKGTRQAHCRPTARRGRARYQSAASSVISCQPRWRKACHGSQRRSCWSEGEQQPSSTRARSSRHSAVPVPCRSAALRLRTHVTWRAVALALAAMEHGCGLSPSQCPSPSSTLVSAGMQAGRLARGRPHCVCHSADPPLCSAPQPTGR